MSEEVRIWKIIDEDNLRELKQAKLDLEERIEMWLERDISIISEELMIIGRQVGTDFGGVIDILCLDCTGAVVIIELKRNKTPRDIVAQILDYASWVRDLSNEKITDIANSYLGIEGPLEEAYRNKFREDLPEILNEHHKMLIVASEIDASSERIINYLSDSYGVGINAASFQYLKDEDGSEFLARVFLIEPTQVEYKTQTKSATKRKPYLTLQQLEEMAERNGTAELYRQLLEGLKGGFDHVGTTTSTLAFVGIIEGSRNTILTLVPSESDISKGLHFKVYIDRLAVYLGVDRQRLISMLPMGLTDYKPWKGAPPMLSGFFTNNDEVDRFLAGVTELKKQVI